MPIKQKRKPRRIVDTIMSSEPKDAAASVAPPVAPPVVAAPEHVAVEQAPPSVPPQVLTDQLFKLIVDAVNKSPDSGPEAVALVEYLFHSQLQPLLLRLRAWAAEKLCEQEATFVQRAWSAVKAEVEVVKASGCCVPKKK